MYNNHTHIINRIATLCNIPRLTHGEKCELESLQYQLAIIRKRATDIQDRKNAVLMLQRKGQWKC